jgi:integrase
LRVALTDRFVAAAKGVGSQVDYFDAKVPGLSLRVSQGGARTWCFSFTGTDRRRNRITLGTYPAVPLAAARTAALEARGTLEAGGDLRAHKASAMTVATLVESYLAKRVRPNLRSAYQVERRLRKNVIPVVGEIRLSELHRRDINRVIDAIVARDCLTEANSVFADLRAMLRWAVKRGDLDRDPVAGMSMPSPPRHRERALSEAEMRALWNALPTALAKSVDCQRIIRLALITGQRVGEISGMTCAELDLPAREWRLSASRTKNKHSHIVPLSDMALGIIDEALADADDPQRLFAIPAKVVPELVAKARAEIGIDKWVPHDLRRTVLTRMAELGVEPIVLGHVANHVGTTKAGVTLGVYVKHTYSSEKRHALDLWADRLAAIVSGEQKAKVIPIGLGR